MQPIRIEPLSFVALIIIVVTLIYSFFKYRREEKKIEVPTETKKESFDYEVPAIVAAIAMMMEGREFKIKRLILSGKQEKVSPWRIFGRQESMRRRMNMQE